VIAFAVLGLAACGQQNQGATGAASSGETPAPDVAAPANQDVKSCLDLVGVGNYEQAIPVCTAALNADAANEQVKAALATANAKVAEMAAKAAEGAADTAAGAAEAAEGAAGAAQEAADDAKEAAPTY
jgi:hypothetical protein